LELQQLPPDQAVITAINGPVIKVGNAAAFSMNELVLIGPEKLLGEVVRLERDQATIQVYEDTTGLQPGLSVHGQGLPLYVELGPGLVGRIFDGTQRPLSGISGDAGAWVTRGRAMTALERDKAWTFTPLAIPGMQAALLVSDQGLVISRAARDGVDTASIAALAIDTVSTVQRFGLQVQAGYLDAMRIEFDKLTVVLAPFAPDVMLALVASAGSLGAMSGDLTTGRREGASGG
jgi:predicted regulator of Ras-like GTPase activity (Roadblock/LC7/MglB family)